MRDNWKMTDHKSPFERALDLLVYAPVGLALTAAEELPGLIEKGRERVTNQVTMAKVVGQFAADKGARKASRAVKQAVGALAGLGVVPGPGPARYPDLRSNGPFSSAAAPPAQAGSSTGPPSAASSSAASSVSGNGSGGPSTLPPDDLAIPGYDALSASQVVQRLDGLAPGELEAVREYETATRGRRTILSKIAQLQYGPS
jgi:hypothetical protein